MNPQHLTIRNRDFIYINSGNVHVLIKSNQAPQESSIAVEVGVLEGLCAEMGIDHYGGGLPA